MTLPTLPTKRSHKESTFGQIFRKWLEANPRLSGAYELKQCGSSLPFAAVKDHQIAALLKVKHEGLLWKIADDSRGVKPFDFFYLRNAPACVVIKFSKCWTIIDIETFLFEKSRSKRRSLLESRAKEIATIVI
jgi:hypothetical protein